MMTRREFEAIARGIKLAGFASQTHSDGSATHYPTRDAVLALVAGLIADECQASNARFNHAQFLAACGVRS